MVCLNPSQVNTAVPTSAIWVFYISGFGLNPSQVNTAVPTRVHHSLESVLAASKSLSGKYGRSDQHYSGSPAGGFVSKSLSGKYGRSDNRVRVIC